ncbi:(2Fe-2S)-binding protein [Peribacillus simplex]|uniref:(2Fe-2S)-binding protein n=1 Tax=Peribacillus simplex TaxID=1478 RepID=UPI00366F692C
MNNSRRILHHPVLGTLKAKKKIKFKFDNEIYLGYEDESIAAALLANGIRTLRYQEEAGTPRGIYCNIGHCFECRVTVDGAKGVRSCLTPIKEGMDVKSGKTLPTPFRKEALVHD